MHGGNHLSINKSLTDTRKRLPGFVLRPRAAVRETSLGGSEQPQANEI